MQYLIPRQLRARYEILPGLGVREVTFLAAAIVFGVALFLLLGCISVPVAVRLMVAPLPAIVVFVAGQKVDGVLSLGDLMRLRRRWSGQVIRYRRCGFNETDTFPQRGRSGRDQKTKRA